MAPEYKINTAFDMYMWYVKKLCASDETLKTESDQLLKRKGIVVVYRMLKGKKQIYITYTMFKNILEHNNTLAREAVIEGQIYNLGQSLGHLRARRIERDFSKPTVNVVATMNYWRDHPEKRPQVKIYFLDDDYVRIAWHKSSSSTGVRNLTVYDFKPCKDFRVEFGQSSIKRPLLKFKYLYFPLLHTKNDN